MVKEETNMKISICADVINIDEEKNRFNFIIMWIRVRPSDENVIPPNSCGRMSKQ